MLPGIKFGDFVLKWQDLMLKFSSLFPRRIFRLCGNYHDVYVYAINYVFSHVLTPTLPIKQLFRKPHRQRKVFSSTSVPAVDVPLTTPTNALDSKRVFYKNLVQLMPSKEPIKGEHCQLLCNSMHPFSHTNTHIHV